MDETAIGAPSGVSGGVLLLIGSGLFRLAASLAPVVHGQIEGARKRTFASWLPARPDLGESSPLD